MGPRNGRRRSPDHSRKADDLLILDRKVVNQCGVRCQHDNWATYHAEETSNHQPHHEQIEEAQVIVADAVGDPGAMMVHLEDTSDDFQRSSEM